MIYESKAIDQAGQDQLDKVAAEFDNWRRQKTSKSQRIPEALLREAQKLTQHLGSTPVRRRLGITKGQLDKLVDAQKPDNTAHDINFMQLVPATAEAQHRTLTIDICMPTGVKISLSGFSRPDPLALIARLIEDEPC